MKKFLLLTVAALSAAMSYAEYRAVIFKNNVPLSQTKVSNIKSYKAASKVLTQVAEDSNKNFAFDGIDSLVFVPDTVYVNYNGMTASVENPLANIGVSVNVDGAAVSVSTDTSIFDMKDVVFVLSGSSAEGSFNMKQLKRTTLLLKNLDLSNSTGAAIAMVGDKAVTLEVVGNNSLTDAGSRSATDSVGAALFVNDNLEMVGSGSLSINGQYKQGIYVKDNLVISGVSLVPNSLKTAIRVKDNFVLNGGYVKASSLEGSGIDVNDTVFVNAGELDVIVNADDSKGIACDGGYIQTGGEVSISVYGNGSKGVKVGSLEAATNVLVPSNIVISGGKASVVMGNVGAYTDPTTQDESSPAGLKADGNITINGTAVVNVNAPEASNSVKGIAADQNITVRGQSVVTVDVLSELGKAWCFKCDGKLTVNPTCVKATCNEDNPRYDTGKSGVYKFASYGEVAD